VGSISGFSGVELVDLDRSNLKLNFYIDTDLSGFKFVIGGDGSKELL